VVRFVRERPWAERGGERMKSWTLLPMAWLLVLGAPFSSLAETAPEELVEMAQTEAEPVLAGPPDLSDAGDSPEASAMVDVDVDVAESAEVAVSDSAVEPAPAMPAAPAPLDPARPIAAVDAADASFVFGPLGVDSEGRTGRIHRVASGDTLWDISDAYLGTPWVWPSVWNENDDIANPHVIVPGDRIWISSTEMRRVTRLEAEALVAAAEAMPAAQDAPVELVEADVVGEDEMIEAVPAALDDMPMSVPMEVTGPAPTRKMISIDWKESLGFLSKDAVDASTSIVGSPSVRNWLSQGDPVVLGLGAGQVKVGDKFMIFEEIEAVRSLETEFILGFHVNNLGWVEVTDVSAESSAAIIREAWYEITRGARVVPRGKPTVEFELQPASRDIEGRVVFTPSDRTAMGTIDHVYLDIGETDGLVIGSELELIDPAYKSFDSVRRTDVVVPDQVTGQMVVISMQPRSSVAIVTHTRREVEVGQAVRGSKR
jgi:hypothetical protein